MGEPEYLDNLGVGLPPPTDLPKEAVITGRVVKIEDAYARELSVPKGLVAVVLAVAIVARTATALLALVLRAKPGGDGRGWKALTKGPEFRVTPVWIRDTDGLFVEVEVQGYLADQALRPRDRVQVRALRQDGRHLPMRAQRIDNLTIGRRIVPHRPTLWSHFGPSLLLQAMIGLVLVVLLAISLWGAR